MWLRYRLAGRPAALQHGRMMIGERPVRILLLVVAALAACSSQQVYDSTSELRAQQCGKLEARERDDCLRSARTPYAQYQQARDEIVSPAPAATAPRPARTTILPLSTERPTAPRFVCLDGIAAWVEVGFTVQANGRVADVQMLQRSFDGEQYDSEILDAVSHWIFAVGDGPRRIRQRLEFHPGDCLSRDMP